jgi:hypothetical protein
VDLPTMSRLGVADGTAHEGENETGHPYRRISAALESVAVGAAVQESPTVCFEAIRYDGVLGGDFLRAFAVTFDLEGGTLRLASPGERISGA